MSSLEPHTHTHIHIRITRRPTRQNCSFGWSFLSSSSCGDWAEKNSWEIWGAIDRCRRETKNNILKCWISGCMFYLESSFVACLAIPIADVWVNRVLCDAIHTFSLMFIHPYFEMSKASCKLMLLQHILGLSEEGNPSWLSNLTNQKSSIIAKTLFIRYQILCSADLFPSHSVNYYYVHVCTHARARVWWRYISFYRFVLENNFILCQRDKRARRTKEKYKLNAL